MERHAKLYSTLLVLLSCAAAHAAPALHVPLSLQKTQLVKPAPFRPSAPTTNVRMAPVAVQSYSEPRIRPLLNAPTLPRLDPVADIQPAKPEAFTQGAQATLVFTATRLNKGYRGVNVGAGALSLFEPGGQCELPPRTIGDIQQVNADQPETRLQIPADTPLVLSSFWSAGGSHCLMGNYGFTAEDGAIYKLTSVQDVTGGVCSLRLQRQVADASHYVADNSLRPSPAGCQQAALGF